MHKQLKKYHKFPKNNLFVLSLVTIIIFLFVELLARIRNWYLSFPEIDIITHFLGGLAIGCFVYWVYTVINHKLRKIYSIVWILVISILWELAEMLEEKFFENPEYLKDYFFWDGFFDIIFALIGGLAMFILLSYLKRKTILFNKINVD